MSPRDSGFKDYVLDQLGELRDVRARPMFGGYGLYYGSVFFGIVADGRVYFKTNDATRPEYERRGMQPFRPNERQTLKRYYEVPPDVLDDRDALIAWATSAAA